ncbi:MAG: hypothetical protein U0703_22655 [Anaerolineae bacterium]
MTGATGFLGGALTRRLAADGACAALARSERAEVLRETGVEVALGDVTDADGARRRAVAGSCSTPLPTLAGMSASGWSTSRDAKRDRRRSSGRR